jgi:hypothetical protein
MFMQTKLTNLLCSMADITHLTVQAALFPESGKKTIFIEILFS